MAHQFFPDGPVVVPARSPRCSFCGDTGVQTVPGMAGGTEEYVCRCAAGQALDRETQDAIAEDTHAAILRRIR